MSKPKKIVIVALTKDRIIGIDGKMPWHHPEDLKRFKEITLGHTVVMGRKTWDSLKKRPLPGRVNVVISTSPKPSDVPTDVKWCNDFQEAVDSCPLDKNIYFIGGEQLYKLALDCCDEIDLTWMPDTPDTSKGEVAYFPEINEATWQITEELHPTDSELKIWKCTKKLPTSPTKHNSSYRRSSAVNTQVSMVMRPSNGDTSGYK